MINFLYVLDKNYNLPMLSSIISLLENIHSDISIYVIHKDPSSFIYKDLLHKYKNLKELNIYQFDVALSKFHFISSKFHRDQHYSEATYYKIFLSDYLPEDIEKIVYIDPDVICINNPLNLIKKQFNDMGEKNILGASTHAYKDKSNLELFERLSIDSKYFNAGVLFINLKNWREKNITSKLLDFYDKNYKKIVWADQDLLNAYFNGKYYEISNSLNYPISSENQKKLEKEKVLKESSLLHFIGKDKPWKIKGILRLNNYYKIYQDNFKFLKINKAHLEVDNYFYDLILIIKSNLKIKEKFSLIYCLFNRI